MSEKKVLYEVVKPAQGAGSTSADYLFWCPGCKMAHGVWTKPRQTGAVWRFNGDMEAPTFEPSLLIQGTVDLTPEQHQQIMAGKSVEPKPFRCHLFVRQGFLQFLTDSTHPLAGMTVPMEKF